MRLDKIYTKTGDEGTSSLATGEKISKASHRMEAYGTVDELNGHTGLIRDLWIHYVPVTKDSDIPGSLIRIQHELFDAGAELASIPSEQQIRKGCHLNDQEGIHRLETEMDIMSQNLKPLRSFVLPGGHRLNSEIHIARAVCRRAERSIIRLHQDEIVRKGVRVYFNRLSDWFFLLSRTASQLLNCQETLWQQSRQHSP